MKIRDRLKTNDILKEKNGMVIFEFMLVIFIAMITVGMLIEFGFMLKSEAIVVGITKNMARSIQVKGEITKSDADAVIAKLEGYKIKNGKLTLQVNSYSNPSNYTTYEYGHDLANPSEVLVGFRQSFKIYVKGDHALNLLAVTGVTLSAPVIFAESGKGEKVDFDLIN